MATSPVEKTGEMTGETNRTIPTPFLTKTYQLVDDPASDDMISWNENGTAFVVWRPAEFARDLLPKYFKHNNFSSFIRQLNTYGFRKIVSDRWEFANDYFRKGEKSLLREIHRRKISIAPATQPTPAVATAIPLVTMPITTSSLGNSSEELGGSSNSSPIATMINGQTCTSRTHLLEENERLKEQNSSLRCELDHLRSMCCNVVTMMSNFIVGQPEIESSEKVVEGSASDPMVEDKMCPRLFGVPIGAKRVRSGKQTMQ
ncbi:putative transcription factor HSF-type-DNA-binding family [Helianthus anomalus]